MRGPKGEGADVVTGIAADKGAAGAVKPMRRGATGTAGVSARHLRYPTIEDLRARARRRVPRFAFDFIDGGCGQNASRSNNRAALDDIRFIPRYGFGTVTVSSEVELFGRRYAGPIGVAPMGLGGLIWPGAELHLATAAQKFGIPYVLATPACATIEDVARIAPDVFWFQLYGAPRNDHRITFDLVRRAEAAGAHVLMVTFDTPVRGKRPQDLRNRLDVPFRPNLKTILDVATSPAWALEVLRRGTPKCENFVRYAEGQTSAGDIAAVTQQELRGGFTWEVIRRVRDAWPRALVVKGIMHPADADQAVSIGADGVVVSNHGGRSFDGSMAAIDVLPEVRAAVGDRATVMMDSGIRTGVDVVRALALGAQAVLAGRPFLYGVAALGTEGAEHVMELFAEETQAAMGQLGIATPREANRVKLVHPAAHARAMDGRTREAG